MKKIILLAILWITILSSCWKEEENKNVKNVQTPIVENKEEKVNIKIDNWTIWTTNIFQKRKIETKMEDDKLTIWEKVVISKWQSEFFTFDFPIVDWWKIYKNSNVKNYWFIISWINTDIQYITKFYQNNFEKLWWEEEKQELPEIEEWLEEIEDTFKELTFKKFKNDIQYEKIKIKINKEIPKILKENYEFEWNYIEFYVSTGVIEIEEPIIEE